MRTKQTICFLFFLQSWCGYSQSITPAVLNAGGKTYADSSISLEWSIGELALVNTMEAVRGHFVVTNGFLQPAFSSKEKNSHAFAAGEVTVLPSPTRGKLEVWVTTPQQGSLLIVLHDANGKEVYTRKTTGCGSHVVERFDLTTKPPGTYFVYISLDPAPGFLGKQGAYQIVKI